MPVWHERTKQWVEEGRLVLLGITQEQHADRCQLFAQWQNFDWPILHDPINVMESTAVPLFVAIDEHGIVRSTRARVETFESDFLDRDFSNDAPKSDITKSKVPDLDALRQAALEGKTANAWRTFADALVLWAGPTALDEAIEAYRQAVKLDPSDGDARFRLGVALRARYDSQGRQEGDFQKAVARWGEALAIDPNQYIWRRRIEQYGPRLIKPYPFYDWVEQAIAEVQSRGEEPVSLVEMPYGAEIASPSRSFESEATAAVNPDPNGRINRDDQGLIGVESAVVPASVTAGSSARVHVTFRPNDQLKAHWNNESFPLRLWVDPPEGWEVSQQLQEAPLGDAPETKEIRRIDFEVNVPADAKSGEVTINTYALYYVCEDLGGVCLFLRQDIPISLQIKAQQSLR